MPSVTTPPRIEQPTTPALSPVTVPPSINNQQQMLQQIEWLTNNFSQLTLKFDIYNKCTQDLERKVEILTLQNQELQRDKSLKNKENEELKAEVLNLISQIEAYTSKDQRGNSDREVTEHLKKLEKQVLDDHQEKLELLKLIQKLYQNSIEILNNGKTIEGSGKEVLEKQASQAFYRDSMILQAKEMQRKLDEELKRGKHYLLESKEYRPSEIESLGEAIETLKNVQKDLFQTHELQKETHTNLVEAAEDIEEEILAQKESIEWEIYELSLQIEKLEREIALQERELEKAENDIDYELNEGCRQSEKATAIFFGILGAVTIVGAIAAANWVANVDKRLEEPQKKKEELEKTIPALKMELQQLEALKKNYEEELQSLNLSIGFIPDFDPNASYTQDLMHEQIARSNDEKVYPYTIHRYVNHYGQMVEEIVDDD